MTKRTGQHAHRFTFQEFASMFAACSCDSQGLTSGNATRHLCSSLLQAADYIISDAASTVALTCDALQHLRGVLQLRYKIALRVIAAGVSSTAAASLRDLPAIPKSPAAVDVVSDTTNACRLSAAADDDDVNSRGGGAVGSSNQVKRQLAFSDSHPSSSSSMQAASTAVSHAEDCFNDDGSPVVLSHIDVRKQEQALHNQEEDGLQLQLQQLNQNLLQKQQRQQRSPHPSPKSPPSFKPARPPSPSAAVSISPSLAAQESAPSASPLPPASSARLDASSPTFPPFPHPYEKKAAQQGLGQMPKKQQQQQMSANHQALIDEAVQAARLQVSTSTPRVQCCGLTVPCLEQSAVAEECMQRARDLHAQLLVSEKTQVQLEVGHCDAAVAAIVVSQHVVQVRLDSSEARAKALEKVWQEHARV
jgi:hypothetical protein